MNNQQNNNHEILIENLIAFKEAMQLFNNIRNPGDYEKKLIEHNKHSTRQTADFCVDNNMCAHGTNGFALFLALAIAKGKLLSKNDRKLAGLVAITGEALTDNKSLKNSMGPSKEDLFDYNFISAIALDRECELGLADEYAKKASSSFTCDYETLITKLSKKFSKYLNINENKIRGYVFSNFFHSSYLKRIINYFYHFPAKYIGINKNLYFIKEAIGKINNESMREAYEKLSKIPVIVIGYGFGKNMTNLEELGANKKEVQYEQINIHYVVAAKEDIEFLQDLTKKITDNKEEISFISREEINLFKEDKLLSDFNDTHNKIIIDKDLPCKWHRLNNCSTENKLVSQKTRIRYSVFSANKLPSLNSQGEDCIASYKL